MARSRDLAPATSIYDDLLIAPHTFSFLASVKLLKFIGKTAEETFDDKILICTNIEQRMLGPEVQTLTVEQNKPKLMINSFGLDVLNGPLPADQIQKVIQNLVRGDGALYDYLSLFNNRLGHLLYEVHKKFKVGLNETFSDRSPYGYFLTALIGAYNNYPYEKNLPLRSMMTYSRICWARSGEGFRKLLRTFFGVPTNIFFATGRWTEIPKELCTAIGGVNARHRRLGRGASMGHKFWSQEDHFIVVLGPLDFKTFKRFLTTGDLYPILITLIQFYKMKQKYFTIKLELKKEEVPVSRLGRDLRLGWHSWVRPEERELQENGEVSVSSLNLYTPQALRLYYDTHHTLEAH